MQCFHSMAAHNLNVSLLMMLLSTLSQPPQAPSQTVDFVKIVTCHPVIISFHSDHHFSSFQLMFSPLLVPMIFDSLSHLKTWSLRLQGQYLYCICIHLHRSSPLPISLIILPAGKDTTLAKSSFPLFHIHASAGGAEGKTVNWADRNHLKLLTKNLKWVLYSSSQLSYFPSYYEQCVGNAGSKSVCVQCIKKGNECL